MKTIVAYLKPHFGRMSLGLFIKFSGTIMDLLLPWILAYMIDDIVPHKNILAILLWGGVMVVCSVVAVVANVVANRMAAGVARDTTRRIRHDLFTRITYLSCSQIDHVTIPSLISRLTSDTYNVHHMIGMMQRLGVRAPILLLGGIMVTMTLEPVLTLVLLVLLPFIGIMVFLVSRKGVPLYTRLQQEVDVMVRTVQENTTGIRIIKALSKTVYEKERFAKVNAAVSDRETKAGMTMAITNPLMNLLLNIGLTFVILVGAWRVNNGLTQPGRIISFLSYFTIILLSMLSITRMFVMYSKGSASAARISDVLSLPEDMLLIQPDHQEKESQSQNREEVRDYIVFEHVSFSYHKTENNLTDISFRLKKGETLGIIGTTGCGKTTVIQLLMRLYDADSGHIYIDGEDVRSIPPERLHTMFGISFQNDVLFADTISENIDFGRRLQQEQIRNAAALAQADEFIRTVSGEYEYELTYKGTNLSGGQKQRLLIARALAGSPDILILDDSSSALDYRTDAKLRRALNKSFQETTTIIVAQRVSSIMHAEHILVLEEGRPLGYGTHQELMESCESYREIADTQMGGLEVHG